MNADLYLFLPLLGGIPGIVCLFLLRRARAKNEQEIAELHQEIAVQRRDLAASHSALAARQDALEVSFQNTRELLDSNRLNRSTRAQALQLFRTGRSADAAATELGIGRREARLLAKVATVLACAS